jgi:hypothetical protein
VFEVDPLKCPACGGEMRIISFITERKVIDRILDHLRDSKARGPPRDPARTSGASAATLARP